MEAIYIYVTYKIMHLRYIMYFSSRAQTKNRFSQPTKLKFSMLLDYRIHNIRETTQKQFKFVSTVYKFMYITRKYTTNFPNSQLLYFSSAFKSKKKKTEN